MYKTCENRANSATLWHMLSAIIGYSTRDSSENSRKPILGFSGLSGWISLPTPHHQDQIVQFLIVIRISSVSYQSCSWQRCNWYLAFSSWSSTGRGECHTIKRDIFTINSFAPGEKLRLWSIWVECCWTPVQLGHDQLRVTIKNSGQSRYEVWVDIAKQGSPVTGTSVSHRNTALKLWTNLRTW